jgi:DNA repair exonuclease SbcCD ATPase subunit
MDQQDRPPDSPADDRWMTFAELAVARGINKASASKLVRRHKWRRQTDNQGSVRILVPTEALDSPTVSPTDGPTDSPSVSPTDISAVIKPLETAIIALREQLESTKNQLDRAENRAEQAETRADRAERAIADERDRADRAESSRDTERSRADELRDRLDDLGSKLDGAQAELATAMDLAEQATAEREAAQIAQGEAEADAAELRQAEAERRARGVLARLKAAWRGE